MLKAAKFGGSSVAGASQFKKVKNIIEADPSRRLVVVSASGKRNSTDHKLTDLLYLAHAHLTYGVSCEEIIGSIEDRFIEIRNELGLTYDVEGELAALKKRLNRDFPVDELVSRGEYFTARMMAEYLGFTFVDAADCIFFTYDGKLDKEKTYSAIKEAYDKYGKLLIPGFYGKLPNGRIKVMTRGGSDITGALVAAACGADVYENWTDVSGILMADPKIVKNPRPIKEITYAELRELASMGASVLHEESVLPVKEAGIKLNIRNTNAPEDPGTLIYDNVNNEDTDEQERFITGITGRRNFDIITVRKHGMDTNADLRTALDVLDRFHVNVEQITLGLDTYALVVSSASLGDSVYDIMSDIRKESQPDDISIKDNIALVAAVGRKMAFRPGVSGRIFNALGKQGISIRTIAQGADELAIIIGVDNSQFEAVTRILYDGFAR